MSNQAKSIIRIKLVANTRLWSNFGSEDMPLWKPVGGQEYIVHFFDHDPNIFEISQILEQNKHKFEIMNPKDGFYEILSGYDLFLETNLTHNEAFQFYVNNGIVDFPAKDLTKMDEDVNKIVEDIQTGNDQ